uniref:Protein LTV1 homolog n=1 Tax=Corethron hystrix TaxID=216773 RepID=A0A7S1BAG0_9STRA|mmetsp:Transcript_18679/g.42671  ORF Transcript_18679/g.42671 Transcript_18679/m.42671 type:complete len:612 (+) Transcript_18679:94-1929(+)
MPRKKSTKFVDRKKHPTYAVVRRSELDTCAEDYTTGPGVDEGTTAPSRFVLVPANRAARDILCGEGPSATFREEEDEPAQRCGDGDFFSTALACGDHVDPETGLPSSYDYSQHMRPISGGENAVYIGRGRTKPDANSATEAPRLILPAAVLPGTDNTSNGRAAAIPSISLVANRDLMDEDIAAALFDFDEAERENGGFGEILDDFVLAANEETLPEEYVIEEEPEAFDYEAHIRALMEKSSTVAGGGDAAPLKEGDMVFWGKFRRHGKNVEEDDEDKDNDEDFYNSDVLSPSPANVSEKLFMQTLEEYHDDEIGALDGHDVLPSAATNDDVKDIDGALADELKLLESIADDYASGARDRELENGRVGTGIAPGSGYTFLGINATSNGGDDGTDDDATSLEEVLAEASVTLAAPAIVPGPMEDFQFDSKSYFDERPQNPFDCESILSTYSNLENHPQKIDDGSGGLLRQRKKITKNSLKPHKKEEEEERGHAQICLSSKTGLPLGLDLSMAAARGSWRPAATISEYEEVKEDNMGLSMNVGLSRNRNESAEEKKVRKQAAKMDKQVARLRKKMMRVAFAEEIGAGGVNTGVSAMAASGGDVVVGSVGVHRYR